MNDPCQCCDPDAPPADAPCGCADSSANPGAVPSDRNRYFTGKYMTARDFTAEQVYFLSRHRLHQRALHGWGIVCGLDVVPHPNRECARTGWVVITPGYALDCYGRELVVNAPLPVSLSELPPADAAGDAPPLPNQGFLLGLRYGELCVEPVPVLADGDGCAPRTAPNRVRETACPCYLTVEEGAGCWGRARRPGGPCPPPVPSPRPATPESLDKMLQALCDAKCGGFLPLAKVRFQQDKGKDPAMSDEYLNDPDKHYIDCKGRRHLPGPLDSQYLTHICHVNWHHGDKTLLSDLQSDFAGGKQRDDERGCGKKYEHHKRRHGDDEWLRLTLTFDGPLSDDLDEVEPEAKIGFYERFFQVCYETETGERRPLSRSAVVHLAHDRTTLHYDVHLECLHRMRDFVNDPVIYVTVNCDFLPDCHGRAVDGNHLYGSLGRADDDPLGGATGDGVEGGVFESWFQLDW